MQRLIVIAVLVAAACTKQDSSSAGAGGSGSSSGAGAGPGSSTGASARPAVITQSMADTFEAYVAAFEKLVNGIDATHGDCKAAVGVIEQSTKSVAAMSSKGEALRDAMKSAKGDSAAGDWFGETFGPRMQAAAEKLRGAGEACKDDEAFRSALNAAMAEYPMMRKKS